MYTISMISDEDNGGKPFKYVWMLSILLTWAEGQSKVPPKQVIHTDRALILTYT